MRIPNRLPQFERLPALFVVAGKQDARIYRVHGGVVERISDIKIPKPRYSDNEGHFKVRIRGGVIRSGAVREIRDEEIIQEFLHGLKEAIRPIAHEEFGRVYLFAPSKTKNRIREVLPHHWNVRVAKVIEGNFYYRSPLYLLERITALKEPEFYPEREEEKKILDRAHQAEEFVRTKDHL